MKAMREAGAFTIGQSQGSALIYGMPKAAFEMGAVIEEAPVEKIAGRLVSALMKLKAAA
jgi:two-component system, chemotaxis family, protein-glutamate methylesterase/glutaminase